MIENTKTTCYDAAVLLSIHKKTIHNAPSVFGQRAGIEKCLAAEASAFLVGLPDDFFAEERDGAPTLLCPECCIDSVLVDGDGYELTEQLVDAMNQMFFGGESTAR